MHECFERIGLLPAIRQWGSRYAETRPAIAAIIAARGAGGIMMTSKFGVCAVSKTTDEWSTCPRNESRILATIYYPARSTITALRNIGAAFSSLEAEVLS